MVDALFEQASQQPPECPVEFYQTNRDAFIKSDLSPWEIAERIGGIATFPLCESKRSDIVISVSDARIWGDTRGNLTL